MGHTIDVLIVVCGPNSVSINNNPITTPKVVNVYDVSSLPVTTADKISFTSFTTTNTNCPILTTIIDNNDLTLVGNEIWRIAPTTI